jgi:hypothetical protein
MVSGRDGQSSARAANDEAAIAEATASIMPGRRAGIFQFLDRQARAAPTVRSRCKNARTMPVMLGSESSRS